MEKSPNDPLPGTCSQSQIKLKASSLAYGLRYFPYPATPRLFRFYVAAIYSGAHAPCQPPLLLPSLFPPSLPRDGNCRSNVPLSPLIPENAGAVVAGSPGRKFTPLCARPPLQWSVHRHF